MVTTTSSIPGAGCDHVDHQAHGYCQGAARAGCSLRDREPTGTPWPVEQLLWWGGCPSPAAVPFHSTWARGASRPVVSSQVQPRAQVTRQYRSDVKLGSQAAGQDQQVNGSAEDQHPPAQLTERNEGCWLSLNGLLGSWEWVESPGEAGQGN